MLNFRKNKAEIGPSVRLLHLKIWFYNNFYRPLIIIKHYIISYNKIELYDETCSNYLKHYQYVN